jgi:hypothetical protein
VARVVSCDWAFPGDWDARRLLRFLAGLAMLTLAFTAPAAPVAPISSFAPVQLAAVSVAAASAETSVTLSESVPATSGRRVTAVPSLPEGLPVLVVAVFAALLTGRAPRVRHTRAPPAA